MKNIINVLGRTQTRSVIKIIRFKYLIRVKGRYDFCLPTSSRVEEWGHLWHSTGKGKVVFQQREDNADDLVVCQQLIQNISLRWKF